MFNLSKLWGSLQPLIVFRKDQRPIPMIDAAPRRMFPTMAARTGDYVLYQS